MKYQILTAVAVGFLIAGCGEEGEPFGDGHIRGDAGVGGATSTVGSGGKGGSAAGGSTGVGGHNDFCDVGDPCAQASIDHGTHCACHTMPGPARGYCQCDAVATGTGGATSTGGATGIGGSTGTGGTASYPACSIPAGFTFGACTTVVSATKTLTAFKDGRTCLECNPFTAETAECLVTGTGGGVCVHSCGECTDLRCVAPGCRQ